MREARETDVESQRLSGRGRFVSQRKRYAVGERARQCLCSECGLQRNGEAVVAGMCSFAVKSEARGAGGVWQERDASVNTELSGTLAHCQPMKVRRLDHHSYPKTLHPKNRTCHRKIYRGWPHLHHGCHTITGTRYNDSVVTTGPNNIFITIAARPVDL